MLKTNEKIKTKAKNANRKKLNLYGRHKEKCQRKRYDKGKNLNSRLTDGLSI